MNSALRFALRMIAACGLLVILSSCSSDEDSLDNPPQHRDVIDLSYENPIEIEVSADRRWALLLHNRESSSGPALQLVDLQDRSVIATRILDYYDVYDVEFLPNDQACFAGRPQGNIGYAVQFLTLPDLAIGTRVMTADTAGEHGYLAVDSIGRAVYYTHAGGGNKDGIFKISTTNKRIIDADTSREAPSALDNGLISGLFNHPGRIAYDNTTHKLVVANTGADFVTLVDIGLWGTLVRDGSHTFPVNGTSHVSTAYGAGEVRPWAMCGIENYYVFAGTNSSYSYLARFGTESENVYFVAEMPHSRAWRFRNADLCIHPEEPIFSVFIMQQDSGRQGIGRYRLNTLQPAAQPVYRTRTIPDSSMGAIALDLVSDKLIVADADRARLELVGIE